MTASKASRSHDRFIRLSIAGPAGRSPPTSPTPQARRLRGLPLGSKNSRPVPTLPSPNREDDRIADVDLRVTSLHAPDAANDSDNLVACKSINSSASVRTSSNVSAHCPVVAPQRVRPLHEADVIERALHRSTVDVRMPELGASIRPAALLIGGGVLAARSPRSPPTSPTPQARRLRGPHLGSR